MLENEEREKKNAEMLDLQKKKENLEIDIEDNQAWSKLSIVEITALMTAAKNRFHGAKGNLSGAAELFGEIQNSQRAARAQADKLETTVRMTDSKIKKLKKDLRTPEEVKVDEEALERRKRRAEVWT